MARTPETIIAEIEELEAQLAQASPEKRLDNLRLELDRYYAENGQPTADAPQS